MNCPATVNYPGLYETLNKN